MSRINRISSVTQADGSIDIVVPAGMAEEFKTLVRRATNTWQDQSVEIRDFTDRLLGIDKSVGACMKQELFGYPVYAAVQVQVPVPKDTTLAKRSCCGTLLREPHHTQCFEVTGKYIAPVIPKDKHCEGHPETCNCAYHAR